MPIIKKIFRSLKKLFTLPKSAKKKQRGPSKKRTKSKIRSRPKPKPRKKSPKQKVLGKGISQKTAPRNQATVNKGILIGEVTHYFSRISVVVVKITKGDLKVGDRVRIEDRGKAFAQKVKSMQIESVDVKSAKRGQLIGMKVEKKTKPGAKVFKI